ncbi:MAG: FAD-dependent oxidoreductase, partial [Acidimicrobiales bacterium]
DVSMDRIPHAGRDPVTGAAYALGYSGTGVALATHLGAALARWLDGEDPPAFAGRHFPAVPHAARRSSLLALAGTWFKVRDRLGR